MPDHSLQNIERIKATRAIGIGCSAGGFLLMQKLVACITGKVGIPFFLIIHRNIKYQSRIVNLTEGLSNLNISEPEDKDPILPDTLYIAPAGYHMLVEGTGSIALDISEPVMFCRPSIDISFESLADAYGEGLTLLLLSGANADGATGLSYARKLKAFTVVQDPDEAEFSAMPSAAIKLNAADLVCTIREMQELLEILVISRKT